MAVYKSTRCYPFLNSLDVRVTQTPGSTEIPVQYLKCKVDTSNKKITGYKIRILDEANNVVFNPKYISPISELQEGEMQSIFQNNGNNSGLNGTYLYIPFFQSFDNKKTLSYNAIYYIPKYSVDHIVMDQNLCNDYDPSIQLAEANDITNSNWSVDPITHEVYYGDGEHPFTLDGETILEGQIILFAASSNVSPSPVMNLGFYQVIKKEVGNTWYTALQKINDSSATPLSSVVMRGKNFHGTCWTNQGAYYSYNNSAKYKIFENSTSTLINGPSLNGALYKWEITLYQGEGITQTLNDIRYQNYLNLDNADYDMIASSGTILGSNSSRIQIASDDAFTVSGDVNTNAVLPELNRGVLVLQGKYMGFGNSTAPGIFNEKRIYVQTYDSSYGHVYPIEGDLEAGKVNYYDSVQFFKYSNDSDSIKETDTVMYGCGYNVPFYLYSSNDYTTQLTLSAFMLLPINERRYGIRLSDLPYLMSNTVEVGNKLLLTGQTDNQYAHTAPYQNGVYEMYTISNSGKTDFMFLKRAASYDTWANYLGKVIYCPNYYKTSSGAPSVTNQESLAAAGTYELWDPDNIAVFSGCSELYFTDELPVLLFETKLNSNYTYDLLDASGIISNNSPADTRIDGIMPQEGYSALSVKTSVLEVYKVVNSSGSLIYNKVDSADLTPSTTDYYYISQGQNYGKRIFKGLNTIPNWDLYTAHILKNNINYTYISPFINVKKDMRLKLLQDKTVTINSKVTSWVQINNVNNLLYCIYHPTLSQSLVSEKNSDTNTPWRYEIRTFFKTSDENPFYSYEMPYLILSKNNVVYSSLLRDDDQEYWVTEQGDGEYPFKVETDDPSVYQNFVFNSFKDADIVYGRSVKFSANYVQFDGLSWESYRWTLYNKNGDLLQDTGKKYDKTIAVIFYGLSDDSSTADSTYYAVLEVEDEKQNKVVYIIKFYVQSAKKINSNLDFRASVNCDIHAIKLDFSQYRFLKPSFRGTRNGVEIDKSVLDEYGYEGGVSFEQNIGATIYNTKDAPIDYLYGSNIAHGDGQTYTGLTYSGAFGLPYYTTFNRKETEHKVNNSNGLFIEKQGEDIDGQFYFETAINLDPDFCGSIVSWSVEKEQNDADAYPYMTEDGTEFSKVGFVTFELKSASNFLFEAEAASGTNYSLNPNRNQIILDISIDNGGSLKTKSYTCNNIILFDISSFEHGSYYYIQPSIYNTDTVKDGTYEFLEYDLSYQNG